MELQHWFWKAGKGIIAGIFSVAIASNALAGNFCTSGHDTLLHTGQRGFDLVILDYLRGAGTPGEIPAANYSLSVIGSNVGNWGWSNTGGFNNRATGPNTPLGYLSTTYYDTAALNGNPVLQAEALSHSGLVVLSHTSCGGCDLSTAGSAVINTQMAAGITAAFNAGMDLWAGSGANLATFYDFLPPAFATTGPPIAGSSGFVATVEGLVMGILPTHINGFQTHNRFAGFDPILTVMETRAANEFITLCAQEISLSGNLSPAVDFNPPGTDHTVNLEILGTNVDGIDVVFNVISGPNNGDNDADTSNEAGLASFTYTGDGGIGVDEIEATFDNEAGDPVKSNTALKFWDYDCNENNIPDTCDIDCGAFDGRCNEFSECGGSTDADNNGKPDECNQPPDCSAAYADPDMLWPPNHKGVPIDIAGVTDPDGDDVVLTATGVWQDEEVLANGSGSGNTAPDASLSPLEVRAERNGNPKTPGNGRVYHIFFDGDDGNGGTCSGEVTVCVPHDQGNGNFCLDEGPLYDSISLL
jgi:hypothetical protein